MKSDKAQTRPDKTGPKADRCPLLGPVLSGPVRDLSALVQSLLYRLRAIEMLL